jgi:SAM-dependent methyltransferase|tara:strand:+ start:291 stop:1037 length:747 start_codon:yes stop_codon:yes gene_type:complete
VITVTEGGSAATMIDKVFSWCVAMIQQTAVRGRVSARTKRRGVRAPSEEFHERLVSLGLKPERMWWGPMTLFPTRAEVLVDAIEQQPPRQVLEVGCGTSSALLAALGYKHGFKVIGLENHQSTIDYIDSMLEGLPCAESITVRKCGFARYRYPDRRRYRWFDAGLEQMHETFDFVFVDGPMGSLVGRNGALPQVVPFLEPGHRIFLDDHLRDHEQACIEEWRRYFPGLELETIEKDRGVALITVPLSG